MEFVPWILVSVGTVVAFWVICSKAGIHPALSLVAVIPVVGALIVLYIIAFVRWPNGEAAR